MTDCLRVCKQIITVRLVKHKPYVKNCTILEDVTSEAGLPTDPQGPLPPRTPGSLCYLLSFSSSTTFFLILIILQVLFGSLSPSRCELLYRTDELWHNMGPPTPSADFFFLLLGPRTWIDQKGDKSLSMQSTSCDLLWWLSSGDSSGRSDFGYWRTLNLRVFVRVCVCVCVTGVGSRVFTLPQWHISVRLTWTRRCYLK